LENIVVAHARAYDAIKQWDSVKAKQNSESSAQVGLIQNVSPMFPNNPKHDDDMEASVFASHLHNLYFIEAISEGWLDENLDGLREKNERKSYLRNHLDWIGINYYNRNVIRCGNYILSRLGRALAGIPSVPMTISGYGNNCRPKSASLGGRPTSDFGWEIYPEGLTDSLKLMSKYGKPMFVTENGIADSEDKLRPHFIESHLRELNKAISLEKLDVRGYFHWALIDNYEWAAGFKMRFGLYDVDFGTKARVPRKSAEVYRRIIETKEIPVKDSTGF
jgi:beta-galactosidase